MKVFSRLFIALAFVTLLRSSITLAQSGPPVLPQGSVLNYWPFDDTNLLSGRGFGPTAASNLLLVPSWNNYSLQMDDTNPCVLIYNVVDTNAETGLPETNLTLARGTWDRNFAEVQTETASNVASAPDSQPITQTQTNSTIRSALESRNKLVEVWGKVVDQDGAALEGVNVKAEIGHFVWPPEEHPNGVYTNLEFNTDVSGQFHIRDDSATGVYVALQKEGYEQESSKGYPMETGGGDIANPIVFRMWSTNIHERLITGNKSFEMLPDGRPYFISLSDGTISESAGGDLKVWIRYTNQVESGHLYDWSAGIEMVKGGLFEVQQQAINSGFLEEPPFPMFSAPKDGYTSSFSVQQKVRGGQSGEIGNRFFYIFLRDKNEYGRVSINLEAPSGRLHPGLIRLSYTINPSGSRILRQ